MNRRGAPVCRGEHREASPEGGISRAWLVVVRSDLDFFQRLALQNLGEYFGCIRGYTCTSPCHAAPAQLKRIQLYSTVQYTASGV